VDVSIWICAEGLTLSSQSPQLPVLALLYRQYLDRQDSATFISRLSQTYTQGTLERLAQHVLAEIRRAAVLALGFVGDYEANHVMGLALVDKDRTVRTLAENGIRHVWTRAGNQRQRQLLGIVIRLNTAQQFEEAVRRAGELIGVAPWFAEAWNQRAVGRYALGRFAESIRDCHQTLEINPYHFAAASGMGHAYLELGNHVSALESFRRALRLNPGLEGVRAQVERISRIIEGK